ncbi:MAG: AAA domain-containing protein [Candidatus Helarchaeota archaeon]
MSRIFYANLPDCENYEIIRLHAHYDLREISRYLRNAIKSLKKKIYYVPWEKTSWEELDADEKNLFLDIKEHNYFLVRLVEPEDKVIEDSVFQEFYFTNTIFEVEFENDKIGKNEIIEGETIRKIDTYSDKNILILEKKPKTKLIGVRPYPYQLIQQIKALNTLQSEPHPDHRPLIALIEDIERVDWRHFTPSSINNWSFLEDDSRPGTLEQREFVMKAITTPDFAILEGPPGSGKTTTICELIVQLINKGKRILLCASTHVAVDNVLEMLIDNQDVIAVRIGDKDKISLNVLPFQIENRKRTERKFIIDYLSQKTPLSQSQDFLLRALKRDDGGQVITNLILDTANLICGTVIGILQHPEIKKERFRGSPIFDYLIIDEASKTTFQEFLVPAIFAKKWIIVGDPRQLSPYVETSTIESNLSTLLDSVDQEICRYLFYCKNNGFNLLVIEDDVKIREKFIQQAKFLGLDMFSVSDEQILDDVTKLTILGSQIIIGNSETIKNIESMLPMDFFLIHGEIVSDILRRRNKYWREQYSETINKTFEEKSWDAELAWRLARSFELRRTPKEQEYYEDKISQLLPVFLPEGDNEQFIERFNLIKRIAFPSIIELFKDGFKRTQIQKEKRKGTTLSDGFPKSAFAERSTLLTYQHRMHPDISAFPREFIYEEEALQDPNYIKTARDWKYTGYNKRSIWLNIKGNDTNNQNLQEVDALTDELEHFLDWARFEPRKDGNPWEIAILTFYRAQEKILRRRFQNMFRSNDYQTFKLKKNNVIINLCTVDRFQGHEADLVFLSFVRNWKPGFLDCVNRLNVSITRARYQLVMVGNKSFFERQSQSKILRNLALNTKKIMKYRRSG